MRAGEATGALIDIDDLPDDIRHHPSLIISSEHVRPLPNIEGDYTLAALERSHENKTLTAGQLRIRLATLRPKLGRYAGEG